MIKQKYEIALPTQQEKMIISGWGEAVLNDTIVEKIIYINDGLNIPGYIAYPRRPGSFPGVIWNRGGYGMRGCIDDFTAKGVLGELASWGYCVFASMYRGSSLGEGTDELGGGDLTDVFCLMDLADTLAPVTAGKWGVEGWSRGGFMSLLALLQRPVFTTAILTAAITDFQRYYSVDGKKDSAVLKAKGIDIQAVMQRSPLQMAENLPQTTKYLVIHGAVDDTVSPEHSIALTSRLLNKGACVRSVILENGDHFLKKQREETRRLREYWYTTFLK